MSLTARFEIEVLGDVGGEGNKKDEADGDDRFLRGDSVILVLLS